MVVVLGGSKDRLYSQWQAQIWDELRREASQGFLPWAGLTDFKPGYWIGVRYDEPLGKNDGR